MTLEKVLKFIFKSLQSQFQITISFLLYNLHNVSIWWNEFFFNHPIHVSFNTLHLNISIYSWKFFGIIFYCSRFKIEMKRTDNQPLLHTFPLLATSVNVSIIFSYTQSEREWVLHIHILHFTYSTMNAKLRDKVCKNCIYVFV